MQELEQSVSILIGRSVAVDLLLRALYVEWAQTQSDPNDALFSRIETIIGSMWENGGPKDEADAIVYGHAEEHLRVFYESVKRRLEAGRNEAV